MNFKRGKPKNARGGCLMCKWWKINGVRKRNERPISEQKRFIAEATNRLREKY